jgi:hypothetical protein
VTRQVLVEQNMKNSPGYVNTIKNQPQQSTIQAG